MGAASRLTRGFREGGGRAKGVRVALKVFRFFDRKNSRRNPALHACIMEAGLAWV